MDEDTKLSIHIQESLYGSLSGDDCHRVGIMGGCGVDCWVYQEGRCPVPGEIEEEEE